MTPKSENDNPSPRTGRTIAIGDIHGCIRALEAVLDACQPTQDDIVVTLGDYVDRGEDTSAVIERLIRLGQETTLYPILGNHDEMLLEIADGSLWKFASWLTYGGKETLQSYGAKNPGKLPGDHLDFLRSCVPWTESDTHIFMHANYQENRPMDKQMPRTLRWESLRDRLPGAHRSGKKAIVGHTSQKDGEIYELGYLVCIDTCCYGGGYLTAMDLTSGDLWQADRRGRMRDPIRAKR